MSAFVRSLLFTACLAGITTSVQAASADGSPLWIRYPAVSPDGRTIAFAYGGQIWRVAAEGGEAVPLTSGDFYSTRPVWSPDGARLAFGCKRHGNMDVFVMPAAGGEIVRLTEHSSDDLPFAFSRDGALVYFASARLGGTNTVLAGTYHSSDQLYTVPAAGGRTRRVLETPALEVSVSPDGKRLLYENRPVYENEWRKGAVSAGTRDIWLYDTEAATHRRLTTWRGEDRNARWTPDGSGYYYLSETSGSFNVWRQTLAGGKPEQLTAHTGQPVRFLSVANDGTLVYGFEGSIWRLPPEGAKTAVRVPVHIAQASLVRGHLAANANEFGSEIAVAPGGGEVAVVARGDVFVVSMSDGRTRRITTTPAFERDVSFHPDGHTLLYSSDRDGDYDIFEASIGTNRASFLSAGPVIEKKIVDSEGDALFPAYAPDGTRVAFLDNRVRIQVHTRADGKSVTVLPEGAIYSYIDGDITFTWSPDSRWLAAVTGSIVRDTEISLLDASGRLPPRNVSRSGFRESDPQFTPDSQALCWNSERDGLRGADANGVQSDVYIAHLTRESWDAFRSKDDAPAPAAKTAAEWEPELAGIRHRTVRLTPFSSRMAFSRISADGRQLVFATLDETQRLAAYRVDVRTRALQPLFARPLTGSHIALDAAGENLYLLGRGGIERIHLADGAASAVPFEASIAYDPRGEVEYFFQYFWRITKLKFYQPGMHGVDWDALRTAYEAYLPHIHQWEDFADLMGELAGHLNASHMGCYYLRPLPFADHTASLGILEDSAHTGAGVRVLEVLPGAPCDRVGSPVTAGAVILAVDGVGISPAMNIDGLLNQKAGVPVQLTVQPAGGGAPVTCTVAPVTMDEARALSVARWVDRCRAGADALSGGRIGYVYIPEMDDEGFRGAITDLFGEMWEKEAVIIDVRFNGGGNLHDQLLALLTGEVYAGFTSRTGQLVGRMPINRWAKPTALLANAGSYSDGSIFPNLYKRQKLGPFIGDPVPGTGTAVWWMLVLNGSIKYGIPQIGAKDFEKGWFENQEIVPDVPVHNDPDSLEEGRDLQLEAGVKSLMSTLK